MALHTSISASDTKPGGDEVPFSFQELFFSRTTPSGLILSGNSVFQRISGYAWEELLNKPHKIVRHPDMPRAVFWQLWATIQAGRPLGAYVKNRAKDGRHYWVYAIVTPIEGGFLSVRLKPASPLFETVKAAYADCLRAEAEGGLAPADSAAGLLASLAGLGFPNYANFMAVALREELAARDLQLGRPVDRRFAAL